MPPKGRQSGNPGGKGKGKDNASLEEAEKEGGAEERNTKGTLYLHYMLDALSQLIYST